jgi:hypothetical protein
MAFKRSMTKPDLKGEAYPAPSVCQGAGTTWFGAERSPPNIFAG